MEHQQGWRGCQGLELATSDCGRVSFLGYGVPGKVDKRQSVKESM